MQKEIIKSLKAVLVFSVILGLVYPVFTTIAAKLIAPYRSNGSILKKGGQVVGSELIGQGFYEEKYFQGRPSAGGYNASSSGGSNYGPSNSNLLSQVRERVEQYMTSNECAGNVPPDSVLSSASGLDPHISIENALIQSKRVAKARNCQLNEIQELVSQNIMNNFLGIWGERGVNVLKLNMCMDAALGKSEQHDNK